MGILPEAVDRATLLGFYEALMAEELIRDPRTKLKHTIGIWNICHRQAPDWPNIHLSSPFQRDVIRLQFERFPASFRADLDAWRTHLLNPDLMDLSAPRRPLKTITVDGQIAMILRFASALVHGKVLPIEEITDLRVLVSDVERFKAGLRFFLDRFEGRTTAYIAKTADTLRAIAKYYVQAPEEVYGEIERICRRLHPPRNYGLKAKNRERLRQFDDPKNVARLLSFPQEEAERGRNMDNPYRKAKCFERAVAVNLLISTCLRIQNLRTIRLDTDISRTDERCFLSIPGERVKKRHEPGLRTPGGHGSAVGRVSARAPPTTVRRRGAVSVSGPGWWSASIQHLVQRYHHQLA